MNIHLPAILGFTRYQGFDPSPYRWVCHQFFSAPSLEILRAQVSQESDAKRGVVAQQGRDAGSERTEEI